MWQQGSLVELDLIDLASNGSAIGRFQNRVVFVPNGVPGDRVLSRLIRVKTNYAEGKLTTLLIPSPDRIQPPCILAEKCGGCQWQHVEYSYQLRSKRKQVVEALKRIGGLEVEVGETLSSTSLGYRNKVIYPLSPKKDGGGIKVGYYQKGTHKIVNLNSCPVQDPRLDFMFPKIKQSLMQWKAFDEVNKTGELRHLSMRIGQFTGEVLVTLVATKEHNLTNLEQQSEIWRSEFPSIVGVCLNLNKDLSTNRIFGGQTKVINGRGYIVERFCELDFHISSTAFFQVNTQQAERMVNLIMGLLHLKGEEVVVDGYSGIGTMILPIARHFPRTQCWGIDSHPDSIQCARNNAQINQITNIQFTVGRLEHILPEMTIQPDIVILDPPRKGCDERVLEALMNEETGPDQIVYVSCKASTLARDLKFLTQFGHFTIQSTIPIDLFPQTSHVESISLIKRRDETEI